MWSPFFDPVIARYIRERLASECKASWGATTEIARECGLSKAHISSLVEGSRGISDDVAAIFCKYWGIKQGDIARIAHEAYNSHVLSELQPKTHPELEITLQFCHNLYPEPFLKEFELSARRQPDRPKFHWFLELHAQFRAWFASLPPSAQRKYGHFIGLQMPLMEQEPASPAPATGKLKNSA